MDDDSDLEFELESDPPASAEATLQAAACLKVLKPPSFPFECDPLNTNPSDTEHAACPASRKYSSPVSLDKQRESTGLPNERLEGNETPGVGSANKKRKCTGSEGNETVGVGSTAKKKRKLWTEEEDTELIAAVKKHGEGNWANILKGDFKHDRTASQISQRWSVLKKKLANSNTDLAKNSISLAKSEALDATRVALNSALKMPMARSSSSINLGTHFIDSHCYNCNTRALHMLKMIGCNQQRLARNWPGKLHYDEAVMFSATLQCIFGAAQSTTPSIISTLISTKASESLCRPNSPQVSNIQQEASNMPNEPRNSPQTTPNIPPVSTKTSITTGSLIKAAAVAAGGRMVAPSDAISLFKAAQTKNIVHIRAGGSKLTSSTSGKLQQRLGSFTMPPPNRNSPIISNGNTVASQRTNSAVNAEKTSGNETSASDGGGSNKCRQ